MILLPIILVGITQVQASGQTDWEEMGVLPPGRPGEDPILSNLRAAFLSNDFTTARQLLQTVANRLPAAQAEYWRGVISLRTGQLPQAIRSLRASLRELDDAHTTVALALAYYAAKQFRLFEQFMLNASKRLPGEFAPAYYLGRYYLSTGVEDFPRAEACLEQAVAARPANWQVRYYLGFCEESQRNLERAASNYAMAVETAKPGRSPGLAYVGLARVALLRSLWSEALSYAREAVRAAPKDAEAHRVLARALAETGETAQAIEQWRAAITLDPTVSAAYYQLYRLYARSGQAQLAAEALSQYKRSAQLYGTE